MLKASSMVYALFVVTILAIISGSIVLSSYYYNLQLIDYTQRIKQQSYVQSGVNLLLEQNSFKLPYKATRKLFEDEQSEIQLSKRWWGLMELITVESVWKNNSVGKVYLIGFKDKFKDRISLYLKDNNRSLSLSGKTIIQGNTYLPKSGVKRAYVDGKGFAGSKLIDGDVLESKSELPKLNKKLYANVISNFLTTNIADSVITLEELNKVAFFKNGFSSKTIVVQLPDQTRLNQLKVTGNVILKSKGTLYIENTCAFKDVLIYAKKIVFKQEFEGKLQAFASDTILVEKDCKFGYPSVLCLVKDESNIRQYLAIDKGSSLVGTIAQLSSDVEVKSNALIRIEKESNVEGLIYSLGQLYLGGAVFGSVYTGTFILSTPSSIYENHLLDAEINPSKLNKAFVGIDIPVENKVSTKEIVCEFEW